MILTRFFFIFLFTTGAICLSAKETNEIAEQQLRSISEKIAFPDSAFNMLAVINVNTLSDSLLAEYYRLKGSAYFYKGLADSSIVYFTSAFAQTDSGNCDHQFSKVTNGLAVVLQNSELYEEAIDYYLMALACADQREDYSLKLKVLSNLSILCRETGNIHQGRAYLDQAFELSEQLKDQPGLAFLYNSKGQFFVAEKQYDSAKVAFNQSLIYRGDDDLKGRATSLTNLGFVHAELDNHQGAIEYYDMAIQIRQKTGDLMGTASLCINQANSYIALGNDRKAGQLLQNAQVLNERLRSNDIRRRVLLGLAALEEQRGNLSSAIQFLNEYISLADSLDATVAWAKIASAPYTIAMMESENKVKRVEADRAVREALLKRQRLINLGLAIGLAVFIGLLSLLIYQLRMLTNLRNKLTLERDAAKKSAEERRRTLNMIVHELKTPMNAIISLADLIRREDDVNELKSMTKVLQKSSLRLKSTTNNVLTYSRIEQGELQLVSHEEDLKVVLEELCSMLDIQAKAKKLNFSQKLEESVRINIDRSVLEIILLNLIGNAIKYTDVGGIEVELKHNEYYAFIFIRDTGIGISKEDQERIFEPFFQSETSGFRGREGAGLGLSISKRYAALLDAELKVDSTIGEGSEFTLILKRK